MRAHYRASARLLWHYRSTLSDPLSFDPAGLDGWGEPNHSARGENRTARIPEAVIGPLLAWALRFTDDFAPDILTAAAEGLPLHAARLAGPGRALRPGALEELLAGYERGHRPLPGFRGKPNATLLARKLGCYPSTFGQPAAPLTHPQCRMVAGLEPRPDVGEVVVEHADDPVHLRDGEHGAALGRAPVGGLAPPDEQGTVAAEVRHLGVAAQIRQVQAAHLPAAQAVSVERFQQRRVPHRGQRSANEAFENAREAAGLPAELDQHSLRHSMITHLVEFDYPERFVQDQAGHAVAATTAIYTGVSDEYRNRLLKSKLTARHAGLWEGGQP